MTDRPYFAIFADMRTGSNLLEKTLAELGDTVCYGEAFNPAFIGEPRYQDLLGWDLPARDADPLGFLSLLRAEAGAAIPGFRIFRGHGEAVLAHLTKDPQCRKIVLRRDPLESYISLKIAQETGQWMLRDQSRRITLRVAFDASEFASFQETSDAYYRWLDGLLHEAGQQAFRVSYDQLPDRAVLAGIARHIGSQGTLPDCPPIARQNSPRLADKVSNYAEMCAVLGMEPEDPVTAAPPALAPDIVLPPRVPLAYAPLSGPGFEAAISLIYRLERRFFDGPSYSQSALMQLARRGSLYPVLGEVSDPGAALSGRRSFTVTCHPALRLRGLFDDAVFGPVWQRSPVRLALVSRVGPLPGPRDVDREPLSDDLWRQAFLSFLDIVAETQGGGGVIPLPKAWRGQAELLDAYRDTLTLDEVADIDALAQLAGALAQAMGTAQLPPSHIAAVIGRAHSARLPIRLLSDMAIAQRVGQLFPDDFSRLGYGLVRVAPGP